MVCEIPQKFGYLHETKALKLLQDHIRKEAGGKGYDNLMKLAKSKLWAILNEAEIKTFKVKYCLERKDPDFKKKMVQVLYVYMEINLVMEKRNEGKPCYYGVL